MARSISAITQGILAGVMTLSISAAIAADKPRARGLGIPFVGTPGPLNAITDVAGVKVGYSTIIEGGGKIEVGKGPVRTGVTAILPRGQTFGPVFSGWYSLNGNGEMTGTTWIDESGFLEGPIMITNTHSVGVVRDAVIDWRLRRAGPDGDGYAWSLPVVAAPAATGAERAVPWGLGGAQIRPVPGPGTTPRRPKDDPRRVRLARAACHRRRIEPGARVVCVRVGRDRFCVVVVATHRFHRRRRCYQSCHQPCLS